MGEGKDLQLSVVVPAFNEEVRLNVTLPHLWRSLKRRFVDFEIIVVDDGSVDKTAEVVSRFAAAHREVRLLRYDANRGKGYAVRTGVLTARGNFVLFSDADLSTPVREVQKLLNALADGHDIAIGSRAHRQAKILRKQPFYRVLMGKTFNKIVRLLTIGGIRDTQCGFKCFTRQAAREIFGNCRIDGFSFDVEALCLARMKGFRIKEVGVLWRNDPQSKVHPVRHSLQMFRDIILIRYYLTAGYYGRAGMLRTSTETWSSP
jgi:dolichyl-phosphate beta-glucosyltransferase